MMTRNLLLALALVAPACADDADSAQDATPSFGGADAKADGEPSDGIYSVRRIVYRCPGAECRALEIKLLNRYRTTCADGVEADSCLFTDPQVSWAGTGVTPDRVAELIKEMPYGAGRDDFMPILLRAHFDGTGLAIDEAWRAGIASTVVHDDLIGAVGDRLGSINAQVLNKPGVAPANDLDLTSLTDPQFKAVSDALWDGVILAAELRYSEGGKQVRDVYQYWTRATPLH